jgi:nucleoside-diphosphate-sugar epimerase
MKIFVLGGTGVIGRYLVPLLVSEGHEVTALVRSAERFREAEKMGAKGINADVFNEEELTAVVEKARPEIIIHQLTALSAVTGNFRKFDQEFEMTNRFRTEVTDTLLKAAEQSGVRRFIVQSFCGWPFAREGGLIKTEEDPLDTNPPVTFRKTFNAIKHLETAVRKSEKVEALALRYGMFYGPGTAIAKDGAIVNLVRKRSFPVVGGGAGIWSFIHVKDAARATVNAVNSGSPGLYNIVDDEPAPVSVWLQYLAEVSGAKPPRKVPLWLGKILLGEAGISMMTQIRGGSNAKAKREFVWEPVYKSWRDGFVKGL